MCVSAVCVFLCVCMNLLLKHDASEPPHSQIIGRVGRLKMLNGSGVSVRERMDAEIRYMQVSKGGK